MPCFRASRHGSLVTVRHGDRSKAFKAETAAGLMPAVQVEFGVGTIRDPKGVALTAEYGKLEEGEYIWSTSRGDKSLNDQVPRLDR